MATLEKIVGQIAKIAGREGDVEFNLVIADMYIQQWNLYIRRSIDRNGVDAQLILPLQTELSLVDPYSGKTVLANGILRSNLRIPAPIRYKTDASFLTVQNKVNGIIYAYS